MIQWKHIVSSIADMSKEAGEGRNDCKIVMRFVNSGSLIGRFVPILEVYVKEANLFERVQGIVKITMNLWKS